MSTQSGISVSEELQEAFQNAQTGAVRVLKVVIEQERLVPSTALPLEGNDASDWAGIPSMLEANTPCYLLIKLDTDQGASDEWLMATFVPDQAPVRGKMLYSSTKATLSRQLGDSKFKYNMFASSPDELSSEGYSRFMRHQTSKAPLTDREREMQDIKAAEGVEVQGTTARSNYSGIQVGMAWHPDVEEAIAGISSGTSKIVQLGIDTQREQIILLATPEELSVPSDNPSYTFYAHSTGTVFIYCCPDTSPVRGRMIYSSNCQPLVQDVTKRGITVVKKLETSTPSEITATYVDAESAPPAEAETSKAGFSRPSRPGKRR